MTPIPSKVVRASFLRPRLVLTSISIMLVFAGQLNGPLWGQTLWDADPTSTLKNVGIGVGTPIAKLHVIGATLLSSGTANWLPWTDGNDVIQLMPGTAFSIQVQQQPNYPNLFVVRSNGTVAIGNGTPAPTTKLAVDGKITAKELVVTSNVWADYVFKLDYRLRPLKEVSAYIQENHHLPEIPSEAEVHQKGVNVGEMQAKLLAKIEELTLHMIQADENNRKLQERVTRLEAGLGAPGQTGLTREAGEQR